MHAGSDNFSRGSSASTSNLRESMVTFARESTQQEIQQFVADLPEDIRQQFEAAFSKVRNVEKQTFSLVCGQPVVVHGLANAQHLNGQVGVCERWNDDTARWHVRFAHGVNKALKRENLHPNGDWSAHLSLGVNLNFIHDMVNPDRNYFNYTEYKRDESKFGWLTEEAGSQLTGYDYIEAIRASLRTNGKEGMSVCELLGAAALTRDPAQFLKWMWTGCHVKDFLPRIATVFVSHAQIVPVEQFVLTCLNIPFAFDGLRERDRDDITLWTDFFSLRQCQKDFNIHAIRSLIRWCGVVVAEFDAKMTYLKRSFCMFEVFAGVDGGCDMHVYMGRMTSEDINNAVMAVDVTKTNCRNEEDKRIIDAFIKDIVGVERLNQIVKKTVLEGVQQFEAWTNL